MLKEKFTPSNFPDDRSDMVASVPGLADILALQSRSTDIDDDLNSVASSSIASVSKRRSSARLSTVKTASYSVDSDDEGTQSGGNEDDQENEQIEKAVKKAVVKGQKNGKKALSTLQTKSTTTKKSKNPTANTSSKASRMEAENRNPEQMVNSRRVEYI